jgi:flagellar biosynthesis/type III secretory pathway protein FliH
VDTFVLPALDETRRVDTRDTTSLVQAAASVVAQAEVEAAAIRASAAAEGYAAGVAEAHAATAPARDALEAAVAAFAQERERLAAEAEQAAVGLALSLAEKVLGTALALRPELVLDVCRGALRVTVERDRLVLLVNPDDAELVRGSVDELCASLGGIGRLEVAVERRVPRGGCIVRTSDGEIDARIAEQLAAASDVLREALARG